MGDAEKCPDNGCVCMCVCVCVLVLGVGVGRGACGRARECVGVRGLVRGRGG